MISHEKGITFFTDFYFEKIQFQKQYFTFCTRFSGRIHIDIIFGKFFFTKDYVLFRDIVETIRYMY